MSIIWNGERQSELERLQDADKAARERGDYTNRNYERIQELKDQKMNSEIDEKNLN